MRIQHLITMLLVFLFGGSSGRSENWGILFQQLTSTDSQTSEEARKKSFGELIPFLMSGEVSQVVPEMEKIAEQLDAPSPIRLQASALIAAVSLGRTDSAAVLRTTLSRVSQLLRDDTPRIRFNVASTLSNLKPEIPKEMIPSLISSLKSNDINLIRGALLGAVRVADRSSEAGEAIATVLRSSGDKDVMRSITLAISSIGATSPLMQNGLAELLETTRDTDLLVSGVTAASAIGPAAIDRLVKSVKQAGAGSQDPELGAAVARALTKLPKDRE